MSSPYVPPTEEVFDSCSSGKPILSRGTTRIRKLLRVSLLLFSGVSLSEAGLVYWGSEGFVVNADSHNRAWTPEFTMELGVFSEGFVPTFSNREQWLEKWIKLGVAEFDPHEARFAGVSDLSIKLPAGADPTVYFWAKNGDDLTKGPEWLLLNRPEWKWPTSSPVGSPALTWTTGTPASPVLGDVGGNGFHLTTERVAPVPVTLAQWLADRFPQSVSDREPSADPDGDGLDNRLEYFLGSNPTDGSSRICPEIRTEAGGTLLTLARNPFAVSRFAVETSPNLLVWSQAESETLQDRPDLIQVRVPRLPSVNTGFFRIKLEDIQP